MVKRVLVGVDGSPDSRQAAAFASALARSFGAEVFLLHVVEPLQVLLSSSMMGELHARIQGERLALGERLLVEVAEEAGLGEAQRLLNTGRAPEVICAEAEELDADLIVVGAHGEGPTARVALGRVGDRVAFMASRNVAIVRR